MTKIDNILNINILQTNTIWENPIANRAKIEKLLLQDTNQHDIILLPEMFSTGFTMNIDLAEEMDGETVRWLKSLAYQKKSCIAGSLCISENNQIFNRMVWSSPEGKLNIYDKRHLFRMGLENEQYSPGSRLITIDCKGWKIRPLICYDLRFPVWSRNVDSAFDILIYFANWPAARSDSYLALLKARAIENQCYVIGINRVGTDGNGIGYIGESVVYDPKGKCLLNPLPPEERSESISLSLNELNEFRQKFPVWKDADKFNINYD